MDMSSVDPFMSFVCPSCAYPVQVDCQLGSYLIDEPYAEGGMSMIYKAHDVVLDRVVAIKILNEKYSQDEQRIAQFEQEARITASISHPNVVRVLSVGWEYGRLYIVMEMVIGSSLEQIIESEKSITEEKALHIASEMIAGLNAAHATGLIHRDVKPGNILFDAEGHVKIVDFGLALMTQDGTVQADEIWATPYYVSPEVLDVAEEDFRSDIYSLGATLYHALTGQAPIPSDVKTTGSVRAAKENITPLKVIAPHLLPETCYLIDKAMALNPDDRFLSYEEMELASQAAQKALFIQQQSNIVQAEVDTLDDTDSSPRAPSRRPMLTIGAVILFFILGGAGFTYLKIQPIDTKLPEPPAPLANTIKEPEIDEPETDRNGEALRTQALIDHAYNQLQHDAFLEADQLFLSLLEEEALTQPSTSWFGLKSVMCCYLSGDGELAAQRANELNNLFSDATATNDILLIDLVGKISSLETVYAIEAGNSPVGIPYYMLAALKNWDMGAWNEAAAIFQKIKSHPIQEDSHYEIYHRLSDRYLIDYQRLKTFSKNLRLDDLAAANMSLSEINEVLSSLETKGRAQFHARNLKLRVHRGIKKLSLASLSSPSPETAP